MSGIIFRRQTLFWRFYQATAISQQKCSTSEFHVGSSCCIPPSATKLPLSLSSKTTHFLLRDHGQRQPNHRKHLSTISVTDNAQTKYVLGIETSCDDTGAAVVDSRGNVIGEALDSQTKVHNATGGIIPTVAKELHKDNVERIVSEALRDAGMTLDQVDAIAVTVEPGLVMSLRVGAEFAVSLAKSSGKPLIPVHHMQAHALTARMVDTVDFPFLVLLASGGHCLLAVARDIHDFAVLGGTQDVSPGDAIDKTSREMRLHTLPEFSGVSFGAMVERMAESGDRSAFPPVHAMMRQANCNFSFAGIGEAARQKVREEYKMRDWPATEVLPNAADICAWFQHNVVYHMCRRLQRGIIYTDMEGMVGDSRRTLVVSGGVASNSYLRQCLQHLCTMYQYRLVCPPVKLCTDNGIMIAWNGMEKLVSGRDFTLHPDQVDVRARSPLGADLTKQVQQTSIKLPKLRLHVT